MLRIQNVYSKRNEGPPPPYDGGELGEDSANPKAEGFEWRGEGIPGSREGGWFNPENKHRLRSDFDNPAHDPHWDFRDEQRRDYRLYSDGSWEIK